jgi:hypothetical protein
MRCPTCPVRDGLDCLGDDPLNSGMCGRARTDELFRRSLVRRSVVLAAWPVVLACPHRGGVLGVSRQVDCGCVGTELTECLARHGPSSRPDAVTIDECTECVRPKVL